MISEGHYLTCPHVGKDLSELGARIIFSKAGNTSISAIYRCLYCDFGSKTIQDFRLEHDEVHKACIRVEPPYEIYCGICGDFQFSSYFDRLLNKKRRHSTPVSKESCVGNTCNAPCEIVEDISVENSKFDSLSTGILSYKSSVSNKGLVNMGATCFMNCVLQCLARCKGTHDCNQMVVHSKNCKITIDENAKKRSSSQVSISTASSGTSTVPNGSKDEKMLSCIPCEYRRVAAALTSDREEDSVVIPSGLLFAVWNFVDYMVGYNQQDAHEFLIAFLNSVDCQLQTQEIAKDNSFSELYSGAVQSTLHCTVCGDKSHRTETFVDLSLTIDKSNENIEEKDSAAESSDTVSDQRKTSLRNKPLTLFECLEYFTSVEVLREKVNCSHCRLDQQRTKVLHIAKLPRLLIFQIKRFDFFKQQKIGTKVIFPLDDLDMASFCTETLLQSLKTSPIPVLYKLIGAVTHIGSLHQGHYFSYVRSCNDGKEWLKCDDDIVTSVPAEEVKSAEAYLLFYERKS